MTQHATIASKPLDTNESWQTYTGPVSATMQMLADTFCANKEGTVTFYTEDGQTVYQQQALYSQEEEVKLRNKTKACRRCE